MIKSTVTFLVLSALTVSCGGSNAAPLSLSPDAQAGADLAEAQGCMSCHGSNGEGGAGPSWIGLRGSQVELEDGTTITVDDAFLKQSIIDPDAVQDAAFKLKMPRNSMTPEEADLVVAYIGELK